MSIDPLIDKDSAPEASSNPEHKNHKVIQALWLERN